MTTVRGLRTRKRYVVIGLFGYANRNSRGAVSYSVLDLGYNGEEVFTRYVGTGAHHSRKRDCERECERLNNLDRYS